MQRGHQAGYRSPGLSRTASPTSHSAPAMGPAGFSVMLGAMLFHFHLWQVLTDGFPPQDGLQGHQHAGRQARLQVGPLPQPLPKVSMPLGRTVNSRSF